MSDLESSFDEQNLNLQFISEGMGNDNIANNESSSDESNYVKGELIATGGLKTVRRARDRKASREVAMAQLRPELKSSMNNERFLREAKTLAGLEHANIVPFYDIDYDEDGNLFYTMKLLSGETLASVIKKLGQGDKEYLEKYLLRTLLGIFIQICNAMIYAHSKDIIHLDLKPENIQISEFGEVTIIDWGMAKSLRDKTISNYQESDLFSFSLITAQQTQVGTVSGTPGFMSPEQADEKKPPN